MNKNISKLHREILDSQRLTLLQSLIDVIKDFVLGGGTALALQLAHRKSFDFDFFSFKDIPNKLAEQISQKITIGNIATDTSSELTFFTKNDIKVTFLSYPFRPYYDLLRLDDLKLFSIKDIAAQKAYTIGRRGEYRDYFDLYTILHHGDITLPELTDLAKKVYGSVFEEKIFLEQLVYFDDLLNFDIIPAENPIPTKEEVENFFETQVENYIKKLA